LLFAGANVAYNFFKANFLKQKILKKDFSRCVRYKPLSL
jgi:hypothetical protein